MELNARQRQLRERDVRKLSPELDALTFMRMYVESNFPQTAALPSPQQMRLGPANQFSLNGLDSNQAKPLKGTSYDNPGVS